MSVPESRTAGGRTGWTVGPPTLKTCVLSGPILGLLTSRKHKELPVKTDDRYLLRFDLSNIEICGSLKFHLRVYRDDRNELAERLN